MKTTWKKRAVQTSMLAIMTTIALGAVSASAADTTSEANPVQAIQMVKAVAGAPAVFFRSSNASLLNQPAHERNYLKMLASTYTPDALADWKKALDDRKQVEADFPKPTFSKPVLLHRDASIDKADGVAPVDATFTTSIASGAVAVEAIEALPPLPALSPEEIKALPQGEEGPKRIFINRVAPTEGQAPDQITRVLPVEAGFASDIMVAAPKELPESFKRQQKLAEAVEADDAEAIRGILPELLKDYVKETESLREMSKKIKEQQPTEAEKK
jgi:hypothetical protein